MSDAITALFTQLQSRYPMSSLVSELVETHADRFIVRALVQVGGVTLATGLAAATTVEAAEDQARLRALSLLGIFGLATPRLNTSLDSPLGSPALNDGADRSLPPVDASVFDRSNRLANFSDLPAMALPVPPIVEPLPASIAAPMLDPITVADDFGSFDPLEDDPPFADAEPEDEPIEPAFEPQVPAIEVSAANSDSDIAPISKPRRAKKSATSMNQPLDLSSLIALTDVEMERTGLSKKRGQAYLMETFNKPTRADLDEEQLLDFLNYLRALPSRYQM